jgi:hypothetical protein
MLPIRSVMLVLLMTGAAMPASAQPNTQSNPPPPSPRPPAFIISPNEIYRGPPVPPDRPDPAPRSAISPPMERAPQLPPMSPRIGN